MLVVKKEKIFVSVICNVLLVAVLAIFASLCFFDAGKSVTTTANSEYNGTIYAGDKNSNKISLMINVYWGTEYLEEMLEIFEKYEIKTTFFVGGTWVKENSELLKKMAEQGHEIASHGYNHKEHGKLSYEQNYQEIKDCDDLVMTILGKRMSLFAPPGGSYNSNTVKAASDLGYATIMWTRDTIDWRDHDAELIFSRATENLSGGDLILMHPTSCTAQALERIIVYVKAQGFEIVPVSETLGL